MAFFKYSDTKCEVNIGYGILDLNKSPPIFAHGLDVCGDLRGLRAYERAGLRMTVVGMAMGDVDRVLLALASVFHERVRRPDDEQAKCNRTHTKHPDLRTPY